MTSRYDGIQNYIMRAGESCFFLCLLSVAEEERERKGLKYPRIDFLDTVRACMSEGWIGSDYFVKDDIAILRYLTGEDVKKEVVQDVGFVKRNQYTIEKWVWDDKTHFKRRGFDVYSDSMTVKYGDRMCTYKYTFKEAA